MPSRQWLHAWNSIRRSEEAGIKALKDLIARQEYGVDGPRELIEGCMTGDGETTLMHQAAFYGRQECVDFMLDNGARANLRKESASGAVAADYAKFNECDVYTKVCTIL